MSEKSERLSKALTKLGLQIPLTMFEQYIAPNGYLNRKIECHALFFYYVNARQAYEDKVLTQPIMLEGEPDAVANFRQLFESTAALYNINPEHMSNYWDLVDAQCRILSLPLLPDEDKYRFNRNIIIAKSH